MGAVALGIIIRNIYLVFIPISGTEFLKPLKVHKCKNDKIVFFMLMSDFWKALG